MSSVIQDEITSVNAIYGDDTLRGVSDGYAILKPPSLSISLQVSFPADYPDSAPCILAPESISSDLKKGEANDIVSLARDVLHQIFRAGEPCIYDFVEELANVLPEDGADVGTNVTHEGTDIEAPEAETSHQSTAEVVSAIDPRWSISSIVTERKSVFIARAAPVNSVSEARQYVQHLLATDKKAAKATHNITAWRVRGLSASDGSSKNRLPEVVYQDCDDDGEAAAGGRLLHLLQLMGLWNVMVVVSRWYGGIHLGPDRFRIINSVAKDALLGLQSEDESGKSSGKK